MSSANINPRPTSVPAYAYTPRFSVAAQRPQSAAPQMNDYAPRSSTPPTYAAAPTPAAPSEFIPMESLGAALPSYAFAASNGLERGPGAGVSTGLRGKVGAWSGKKKALIFGGIGLVLVAVIVGAAVGATSGHKSNGGSQDNSGGVSAPPPVASPTPTPNPNGGGQQPNTLPADHNSVAWAFPQVFANYGATTASSLQRHTWEEILPFSQAACGTLYNAASGGCTMNHIMRMNSIQEINAPTFWSINTDSDAVVEVLAICTTGSTVDHFGQMPVEGSPNVNTPVIVNKAMPLQYTNTGCPDYYYALTYGLVQAGPNGAEQINNGDTNGIYLAPLQNGVAPAAMIAYADNGSPSGDTLAIFVVDATGIKTLSA